MTAPLGKRALLIGTEKYQDNRFTTLACTRADTAHLKQVLAHPAIGAFDTVEVVSNPTTEEMRERISGFLDSLTPDDLAVLYISGHGVRFTRTTGEFFFITSDTDADAIDRTGVSASFVNDQLEQCSSPQKVAIFDCCYSGGFSLGFRTRDTKSASKPPALLRSRGVFVMSSSGPDETSMGDSASSTGPRPSVFTEELVEALRTGRGDTGNDGIVSVEELFHYASERVRKRELNPPQNPAYSTDKVNGRIDLARCYTGPPLTPPDTLRPQATEPRTACGGKSVEVSWPLLLDYYRKCIGASSSDMSLMDVDEVNERYVCLSGTERLLSGDLDESESVPLPENAADLVKKATREGSQMWYGYPAVVLWKSPSGRTYRRPRFAPLFIRCVEVIADGEGDRIRPYGTPAPHPQLAEHVLGAQRAKDMADTFLSRWYGGRHSQLVQQIQHFLREDFNLIDVQPLRPDDLDSTIDVRTPTEGARNTAVLFVTPQKNQANVGLLEDLKYISDRTESIPHTALGALLGDRPAPPETSGDWQPVAPLPLNEGQEDVVAAAMTRRLTVATGPPGTGKSQLVSNLVATAVANGQTVLVASTNNRAVNEVWNQCEDLVPGCLVRTGARGGEINYREAERDSLQRLLKAARPTINVGTAKAQLWQSRQGLDRVVATMTAKAEREAELLRIAQGRETAAGELGRTAEQLHAHFGTTVDLGRLSERARRLSTAHLLGGWRRSRFFRKIRWEDEGSARTCELIGRWADIERQWRAARASMSTMPGDDALKAAFDEHTEELRRHSRQLLESSVHTAARAGSRAIQSLMQASGRRDWEQVRSVLEQVRGWAVTNLSIRRFPTRPRLFDLVIVDEAGQCAIPQVLPVLFRAKRALIIGDAMQLEPIITLQLRQEADIRRGLGISANWMEEHRAAYHRHSAFHAFERAAGDSALLDEHFRCHPAIAEVSNSQFYGDKLTVLTDTTKQRRMDCDPILWVDVSGTARHEHNRSWTNEAEIEGVNRSVRRLLERLPPGGDVGVITPFQAQAERLRRYWRDDDRVQVGTVHTFQGGERDAIVFSLVAGNGMPQWNRARLNSQLNLWNVAITRARAHLVVVGDRELWRGQGGIGGILVEAAENHAGDDADDVLDPMLLRMHEWLGQRPDAEIELFSTIDGHRADAVVRDSAGSTAILLDRGHGNGDEQVKPARHLRLQYARLRLLTGQDHAHRAVRVPAWQLYCDQIADDRQEPTA